MYCEDYPCCGHTYEDPCEVMPYDAPDYYDTSLPGQEHRLCDHESGECNADDGSAAEPGECDVDNDVMGGWCYTHDQEHHFCEGDTEPYVNEDAGMEYGLFGSEA